MRVLHIVKSLGRGGAEMLLQETLKEHSQKDFEFHYIYFLPWKNQMVEGLQNAGGVVVNLPAKNNIFIIFQVKKIIRYIKDNKIDLVHCHLPWAGFVGRLVHKITGIPLIYSEHNTQNHYHFITKIINKLTFNWQTTVVAVSKSVADSIAQSIKPSIPVITILNGVNTNYFIRNKQCREEKRKEIGLDDSTILIGNIAVFRLQKRLIEWIDLLKVITNQYPTVKGCLVGDGILQPEIIAHLKATGMEDKIILPGLQSDVLPWLSAMDIFLMSSSFEGLPIALLEAMSMECAIVSTDAGGINEAIRNGLDGFLVPVEQVASLTEPLNYLLAHPSEIKNFGIKARARVLDLFSIKTMVCQIEKTYFKLHKQKLS